MSRMSKFSVRSSHLIHHKRKEPSSTISRFRRLVLEVLEDRRVLAAPCDGSGVNWTSITPGATGVTIVMTNENDVLVADDWTHPTAGGSWLALFDDGADATPCWDSFDDLAPAFRFTAGATTYISVDAKDGSDGVYLDPMDAVGFPALNLGTTQLVTGGWGLDEITGSWADDDLRGGPEQDTIFGNDSHDSIQGNDDHDFLYGNDGNDTITGGGGTDRIYGGLSTDTINGNADPDFLYGDEDNNTINGDDYLSGGLDNDNLNGNDGQDLIEGNGNDDAINGGKKSDILWSYLAGGPTDQPWNANGVGNPTWYDMSNSGSAPDTDGFCDV